MKNITNILSHLWLLLLLLAVACSDMEETIDPMQMEEEVELNIQLHVLDMQASTRAEMVITEQISSIVAIAFDESGALIKKVDAILSDQDHENHNGTLKIKVPKRTRIIHFLGNYTKESIASITSLETLNSFTTNDVTTMHYWGKAEYNGGNNLSVNLYRNMAKLTLTKGENLNGSCYIAGFVNRNLSGTIVPSGHAVGDTPTIPNNVGKGSYEADNSLGNVYYLFEHANDKNNSPLYVIIEVKAKYYKVAFAAGDTYFPILRNRAYEITVDGIDEMYAENNYTDAVNSQYPINDLVITSVPMTVSASPTEVLNQSGQTSTVTVTIPEGITELNVPTHDAFTIAPPNGLTAQNGKYIVTPGNNYAFTFTVNEGVETGDKTISFSGRGKYLKATGSANITLVDEEEPENEIVTIVANPSATTLNYAANSVEDLLVNVTIPKKVTGLTFSSEDFTIKVVGNELQPTDGAYPITHADDATEAIVPVRIRLNDGVNKQTASFTFSGMSDDANVTVQGDTENITLNSNGDANVRWQGNVPLSNNDYAAIVPLKYEWFHDGNNFIPAGSKLNLEFNVTGDNTSWLEVFEIQGGTENDWTNHNFEELNDDNRYVAAENGNNISLSLTITDAIFTAISDNFRSDFLGETKIAMAIRGAGITLTKVSVVPAQELPTVALIATPQVNSLDYSTNENSISDLIVNVTIPAGVTTLDFSSEYFDMISVNGRTKSVDVDDSEVSIPYITYETGSGPYNVDHQGESSLTLPFRLRLKSEKKAPTTSAGFTFSGAGEGVTVTPATVSDITLAKSGDENVRWQGNVKLNWGTEGHVEQILLPYSWFEGIPVGSELRVEYETTAQNGAVIQFAECKGEWNDSENSYFFEELRETNNDSAQGLNFNSGNGIYEGTSIDLTLTQAVLNKMADNLTDLLDEKDVVMAIQGANVRLKSISVIPKNNSVTDVILLALPNGEALNTISTSLSYGNNNSKEELTLDVTVPAGVTQIRIVADDFDVSWSAGNGNVSTEKTYTFTESAEQQTKRFKFTLNNNKKETKTSTITVRDNNSNAREAIAKINLSPRAADADGETTIWSGTAQLEWSINYLSIDKVIPRGYTVRLNFTSVGGAFKFHDGNGSAFKLGKEDYTHQQDNDTYLNVPAGTTSYEFEVNDIIEGTNVTNGLQGFKLNGDNVTMTSIVIYPPKEVEGVEIVDIDFTKYNEWNLWHEPDDRTPTVDPTNGFCLSNSEKCSESYLPQYHLANGLTLETGTYKITMKVRGSVEGQIDKVGLGSWNTGQTYSNSAMTFTTAWQEKTVEVTLTQATAQGAGFVMCQSGSFIGDLYIQTLKVVKTD